MNHGSIPYFDAAQVIAATPMPALIEALRDTFAQEGALPLPRLAVPISGDASLLVMPAWGEDGAFGVKTVTVDAATRPSIRSHYLLADRDSDRPLAIIDGTVMTKRRTAAASALAASRLARPDAGCLLLLGTGALIPPLIEAYRAVFPLRDILVWGRDRAKADAIAEAAGAHGVATIAEGLAAADIVSAATLATSPLIAGAGLRPGMHVDLIGAFRPDMCEADPEAFARARVFVDTMEGAMEEAGDLLQAIAAGRLRPEAIEGDLAALASGRHPGRDGDDRAITLFKSVGTSIEDLAAARLVYRAGAAA